jgi:hypothetical protein
MDHNIQLRQVLNDEPIIVDTNKHNTNVMCYVNFKADSNTIIRIQLDIDIPIYLYLDDLLKNLNSYPETDKLKLFYSGIVLDFNNSLAFYGIKEESHILYKIEKKQHMIHEIEEKVATLIDIRQEELLYSKGFGCLVLKNIPIEDIQTMRVRFHSTFIISQNVSLGDTTFWSTDEIINREDALLSIINLSNNKENIVGSLMKLINDMQIKVKLQFSNINMESIVNKYDIMILYIQGIIFGLFLGPIMFLVVRKSLYNYFNRDI